MESITENLSLRNKICSSLKWKGKIVYIHYTLIEKIVLGWQTLTILHHEHLQAQLLDSDFCQGIV